MRIVSPLVSLVDRVWPPAPVSAHCDLPCGVYDPAQARIEAESIKAVMEKYQSSTDETFKQRCLVIKEHRADLVKHHLWVLWSDYFKPPHLEQHPNLHELCWNATKTAGATKSSTDPALGQKLLDQIEEIAAIFWATKAA